MRIYAAWSRTISAGCLAAALTCIAAQARALGPESVLPAASVVHGWKKLGPNKTYNSSTLFDMIDGGAQAVLEYAFSSAAHAEYGPQSARIPAITIDVYDMTNPLNAFGEFGSDRSSGRTVSVGTEGVVIGTALNFWKGRYVVRTTITVARPGAIEEAAQMTYARSIASHIFEASSAPAQVRALPEGRKPRSEKYVRANVVGMPFLRNAVTADYPAYGLGAQLFIAEYPTASSAQAALGSYQARERQFGTGLAPLSGVGEAGFRVMDRFQKNVVAAKKGRYVVGVVRARDPNTATSLVKTALARVP